MPLHRLCLMFACASLLAEAALAQGRPAAPRRAEPAPACLVSEFRAMALGTHDLAERGKLATQWLQRNLPGCGEEQLRLLSSNRTSWMGHADSPQLMSALDSALEARVKNKPEQLARLFGAAAPPPRVAGDETVRAGDLAPRPAPVVGPGTPAAVTLAAPPVVVAAGAPQPPVVIPPGAPTPPTKPPEVGKHFDERLRTAVREFFTANRGSGPCPPGLTVKNGRCESAQANRAWRQGQALPPTLTAREAPAQLLEKLGPPPAEHSYVQVDGDLLLIHATTRVVVDAVLDLGQIPPRS